MFWKLLVSEFKRPNANLALSVVVVAASVACILTSFYCMSLRDLSNKHLISAKLAERNSVENCEEIDGSNISQPLFDALILPRVRKGDKLETDTTTFDLIAESTADAFSVEAAEIARIIVPALERRLRWREENCVVILSGMDGVDVSNEKEKPGKVVMGAALADSLSFAVGDKFLLNGEPLSVGYVRPEHGDVGDITIWSTLNKAQQLLGSPGKVNGLFAFDCTDMEALTATVKCEFPRSKILRFTRKAPSKNASIIALNENFNKSMQKLSKRHTISRVRLEIELAILCSMATTLFAGWFYLLILSRARKNSGETAMLLAYGVPLKTIFTLGMLRACLILLFGLSVGIVFACVATVWFSYFVGPHLTGETIVRILDPKLMFWTLSLTSAVVLTAACAASLQERNMLVPELP